MAMDTGRGIELTELLVVHHDKLTLLEQKEGLTSQQLEQHLDQSRATINRHLAALREADVITTTNGTHRLTEFGSIVFDELDGFCHQLHVSAQLPELTTQLYSCPLPFETRLLTGATVTKAIAEAPYQMHNRYLEFWNETERVTGIRSNAAVPPGVVERLKPKLRDGVVVDSLWTPRAATQFLETYPEMKTLWLEEPTASMHITHEPIPVQFGLFDHRLAFTVHDGETGYPRALVDTARPGALEWARDLCGYYRERSQPLAAWLDTAETLDAE